MKKDKFPCYKQLDYRDCGPTCLRMVAKFHGKTFSREFLRDQAGITRMGVTMAGIADGCRSHRNANFGYAYSFGKFGYRSSNAFYLIYLLLQILIHFY